MTALATAERRKKITWEKFRDMDFPEDDTAIYELINGEVMKRASPKTPHQRTSFKLSVEFGIYNKKKKAGEFFTAPYDVFFDEENAGMQPDVLFVSKVRDFVIKDGNGIVGAPDLIIEIVSPGTVSRDRATKKDQYERFGVREYWIVDPAYQSIEVFRLENDRYQLFSTVEKAGKITSSVLPGFQLEVSKVFD